MNEELYNKIKKLAEEIKNIVDIASLEKFCRKYEIETRHYKYESFYDNFKEEIIYDAPFERGKLACLDCIHNRIKIDIGIIFTEDKCNYWRFWYKDYPDYDYVKIKIDYIDMLGSSSDIDTKNVFDEISEKYNDCTFDTEDDECEFGYIIEKKYNRIKLDMKGEK